MVLLVVQVLIFLDQELDEQVVQLLDDHYIMLQEQHSRYLCRYSIQRVLQINIYDSINELLEVVVDELIGLQMLVLLDDEVVVMVVLYGLLLRLLIILLD